MVLAAIALAVVTGAQDRTAPDGAKAADAEPTVDQILNHYIASLGGRSAIERITSRASLGEIEVPSMNLSGTVMIHEKAPDKLLQVVVINGNAFRQGFDGTNGWSDDPADGLRLFAGIELDEAKRDADFFHPLHLREIYPDLRFAGKEKLSSSANDLGAAHPTTAGEVYELEGTAAGESRPDEMYFDIESGLASRLISHRHTADGESDVQEDFSDYRNVDGLQLPFTIVQTGGSAAFTIHLAGIHQGVNLDDSEFAAPQARTSAVQ